MLHRSRLADDLAARGADALAGGADVVGAQRHVAVSVTACSMLVVARLASETDLVRVLETKRQEAIVKDSKQQSSAGGVNV